jgi:CRP-like cAMP-binding protein
VEQLKEQISSAFNLTREEAHIFLSAFTKSELKRNDVFIREGATCNKIGLIKKGLMKCVYYKNGDEIVFEFAYENNFIADYYSFVTNTPSAKEIRCIEDTTLYVITRQSLEQLTTSHRFIESMSRKVNEQLFLKEKRITKI